MRVDKEDSNMGLLAIQLDVLITRLTSVKEKLRLARNVIAWEIMASKQEGYGIRQAMKDADALPIPEEVKEELLDLGF